MFFSTLIALDSLHLLMLFGAGVLAGACNAIAGGGSFFSFPALMAVGLPAVVANASNSIAVWPGNASAVWGYRKTIRPLLGQIVPLISISIAGGMAGSFALLVIDEDLFSQLVPYLLLIATLIFALGKRLHQYTYRYFGISAQTPSHPSFFAKSCLFLFTFYGGFFGAGMGIILMAVLTIIGYYDLQINNAIKNVLGFLVGATTVVIFSVGGLVSWPHTLIVFVGALFGGYAGARIAKRLNAVVLKVIVIVIGLTLSAYYFYTG